MVKLNAREIRYLSRTRRQQADFQFKSRLKPFAKVRTQEGIFSSDQQHGQDRRT